ncbi:tetratricopeptide repeat protein [candidate division FCPU426 bacterium]|nr:tetratricopeptide repeat protein [candidate division FCPU426 bacterium]
MEKRLMAGALFLMALGLASCAGQDPDIRRGDTFFGNKKYYEAFQAYERAYARNEQAFEEPALRERFKNAYYYHGGQLELAGSLEAALKYYEKGFALMPTDAGMCDKLAKYYWGEEDFEKCVEYFEILVELDAKAPDTENKWLILGEDFYALGYSLFKNKKYTEAIEALQQSLKASPRGKFAAKAKSALESAKFELKKQNR